MDYDWETRYEHMPMLLADVQWSLLKDPETVLFSVLRDAYVVDEPVCLAIIQEALTYHRLSYEEKVAYWGKRDKPSRSVLLTCYYVY